MAPTAEVTWDGFLYVSMQCMPECRVRVASLLRCYLTLRFCALSKLELCQAEGCAEKCRSWKCQARSEVGPHTAMQVMFYVVCKEMKSWTAGIPVLFFYSPVSMSQELIRHSPRRFVQSLACADDTTACLKSVNICLQATLEAT